MNNPHPRDGKSSDSPQEDWKQMNTKERILLAAGTLMLAVVLVILTVIVFVFAHASSNNPMITAQEHLEQNEDGIRELILLAASPGEKIIIQQLPRQELTQECSTPDHERSARKSIGQASATCQVSLYGEATHVQANYLIFMEFRGYSLWEILWNRMEFPVRDAYLDAAYLEVTSPENAFRAETTRHEDPQNLRLEHIGEKPP